jgi:Transmembrane amino acid transporter protein
VVSYYHPDNGPSGGVRDLAVGRRLDLSDLTSDQPTTTGNRMEPSKQTFSFWVTVCFTLNYIIGTGFLTLPWAFQQTGYLLGLFCLGAVTLLATVTIIFTLETMARADELTRRMKYFAQSYDASLGRNYQSVGFELVSMGETEHGRDEETAAKREEAGTSSVGDTRMVTAGAVESSADTSVPSSLYKVGTAKFEIVGMFCHGLVYICTLSTYMRVATSHSCSVATHCN